MTAPVAGDHPVTFRRRRGAFRREPWGCLLCGAQVQNPTLHAEWHVTNDTERALYRPNPVDVSGTTERTVVVRVETPAFGAPRFKVPRVSVADNVVPRR